MIKEKTVLVTISVSEKFQQFLLELCKKMNWNYSVKFQNETLNEFYDGVDCTIDNDDTAIVSIVSFNEIYQSVVQDVKEGKIKCLGNTPVVVEDDGKIRFGSDKRTEKIENIELLFNHFVQNKISYLSLDRDDFFNLITQLTLGRTKTIDYVFYRNFLQEMLDRHNQIKN